MSLRTVACRLLAPLAVVLASVAAVASVVRSASIEELVQKSTAVVEVDVGTHTVRHDQESGRIWTLTEVTTRDTLHGEERESWVVATPGGRVGNVDQQVSGAAQLRKGARMVLFLTTAAEDRHLVLGESAGAYTLHRRAGSDEWQARSDRGGLVLVDADGERTAGVDGELSAGELRKRVRRESRRLLEETRERELRRKARADAARERARERSRRRSDLPGISPPRED